MPGTSAKWRARLSAYMERREVTAAVLVQRLAEKRVRVSKSAVYKWLDPKQKRNPGLEVFAAICEVTDLSANALLGLPEKHGPTEPQIDEALSEVETALRAARALLLGPPEPETPEPETPDQDLDTIDRGISEREARKGRTAARSQPERAVK